MFGLEPNQFDWDQYEKTRELTYPFVIYPGGKYQWVTDQGEGQDQPPIDPADADPRLTQHPRSDMWSFGSHSHRRIHGSPETYANDWTPGNYGKAIAYTNPDTGERELWHWSVGTGEDGDTADLYPHHIDYQSLTSTNPGTRKEYGILPNGIAAPVWSNTWEDGDHELFDAIGAQPGAHSHDYDPWQNDQWHFAVIENGDAQQEPDAMNGARPTQPAGFTAYETPPGLQPWVEGGPGKGLLLRDGKRYAWATDRWGDGYPHHLKAIQAIGIPEARQYLDDHPVRAYMTHYQNGWADWPSLGEDYHLWSGRDDKAESNEWKFGNRDFSLLNHLVNNPYIEGDGVNYHTWTPGNRGKGMILPDGRPATWNIEHTEPATYAGPHHRQVAEYLGVGSYPQVSDEAAEEDRQIDIENGFEPEPVTPGWHTPIYINPDGTYGTLDRVWNSDRWHTDNGHPAFDQLGLTRENENNGWTFGKVAWKWNHPWEVQIHEDATGSIEPDFVTEGSRPILYDNNNKIVHIGPMHRYHADLYRHLGVPSIPDVHQGRAFGEDFTVGTYDRTAPEALQAAANALNENDGHTRWMPSSNDVPEHWAFGKVTPKGKVIPFPDDSYAVQGTYDGDRIPFLYGHDSGNFYLGRPGDYHYQVEGEHSPPEATAHGMLYSNATHDWYTRPVNEPDLTDVINTVRAHPRYEGFFRKDAPLPEQQGHEWTFSRVADMVEGDEEEVVNLIGQQAYDEWQFAPRRASRSEGQTWLDVVDGTVDRSWPSHADAVTDTSDKRDEETDDKATHKADTATFTPSKLTPHDAPLSPIPTDPSLSPLVPPTADHDSGAYERGNISTPTSSLASFLASLTPSDEEDDLDPYPIDSGAYTASVSLTSSTPITLINNQGEVGHTDGHRPADMYQVGGARDTAAQPGPGHSDSNTQQGDDADNRPSHKRMVRVQSIREDADCLDQENRKSYHNDPESQWNLQGGSGADTLYGHDLLSMPEAQGGCSLYWTFSKVAGEFPLNVEWMGSAADYAADHSLMIHPQQRRMVIGAPEFHHSDLIERYGQDGWMTGAIYDGELHTHDDPHNPLWDSVELYANRMNDMFGYPPVTRNKDEWKFSKTASKLDWLESRPDKFMQTDEGRQLFQILKVKFWNEKTDPLFPWLWREARKGRLSVVDRENLAILNDDGGIAGYLSAGRLNHWADWYADKRNPTRRGVDLMQLSAGDMVHKINEWEQHNADRDVAERLDGGKVLKTLANGWTVRELEPADLEFEGNEMGHCVGGEGYRRAVENGHTKIISLRDPQGHPHATMELETNMRVRPGEPGRYVIEQVQGKSNEIPKPEYQAMLKDWITGLPEGDRPSWKNEVEEISDLNEIVNPEDDDDPHGWGGYAPHGDYGIPLPPRQTDYDSVISDLHRFGHYDPSHGEALYNHAVQRNEIPQLAKAFEGYQEKAMEDMQDMEDNNMDWLQYPGEYEDQPEFWDKIGQEDGISGRDAHEQAYENYSEARSELAENVPSYQAANHMGDLLSHHWDTDTEAFVNKPGVFSSWNFG